MAENWARLFDEAEHHHRREAVRVRGFRRWLHERLAEFYASAADKNRSMP